MTVLRHLAPLSLILAAALAPLNQAHAQVYPQLLPPTLSDNARISVLTMDPGPAIHARFGHTAIRVRDPQQGMDIVFDYGQFSYDDPMFIPRFIRGQLDYLLGVSQAEHVLPHYAAQRRRVIQQKLRLTPDDRQAIYRLLVDNAHPDRDPPHRYRYRFLDDNCSTRVLDAIDHALGDRLVLPRDTTDPPTYRQAIMAHLDDAPLLGLGINLGLGRPVDTPMTLRQTAFLPLPLKHLLDDARVIAADTGQARPLVIEKRDLYRPRNPAMAAADPGLARHWPAAALWAAFALALALSIRHRRVAATRKPRRLGDAALLAIVGLGGIILLGLAVATEHEVTAPNLNLLWAWPTHLIAAAALLRWPAHRLLRAYLGLTAVALALLAVAWPLIPQPLPWAILPLTLLLALRAADRAWGWKKPPMHTDAHRSEKASAPPS